MCSQAVMVRAPHHSHALRRQIEARVFAHMCNDTGLIRLFNREGGEHVRIVQVATTSL